MQHAAVCLPASVAHGFAEKLFGCSILELARTGASGGGRGTGTARAWPQGNSQEVQKRATTVFVQGVSLL
jgi:hypothetical protein